MTNNWAKWDAKQRGENVRVADAGPGRSKVTSGGKHLGNIESRGGKHVAVMQAGPGQLSSTEHGTRQAALNHIRKAHGLSAPEAAAPKRDASVQVSAPSAYGSRKVTLGGKHLGNVQRQGDKHVAITRAPGSRGGLGSASFDTHQQALDHIRKAHGLPAETTSSRPSTAEQHAAAIRGALGHSGSTHSAAAHGSGGSTAHKVTKSNLKRPAPVKGEKDRADSFRTRIRMAEYNRKKKQ